MDYFNNSLLLENFSYWENKKLYLQLMEKFVNRQIDGRQFEKQFCQMWRVDRDKTYSLKELFEKINDEKLTELEGFSTLISNLFTDCDVFEPDVRLREDYEISEEELRNCVKNTLLEINVILK